MGNRGCFYANSISMYGHCPQGCLYVFSLLNIVSPSFPLSLELANTLCLDLSLNDWSCKQKQKNLYPDGVSNIVKEKSLLGQEKTELEDVGLL